jgi:multiple sugar transport system substrate-binding protein
MKKNNEKKVSRKSLAILLATACVGLSLYPAQAATAKKVEITYWTHEEPINQTFENILIKEFEAKNPTIKINYLPVSEGDIITKLATSLAAGGGPDVVNLIRRAMPQLASKGLLSSVDFTQIESVYGAKFAGAKKGQAKFNSLYESKIQKAYVWEGKQVGIPHEVTAYAMYGNKEMLAKGGFNKLPETWDELISMCSAVNAANPGAETLVLPLNISSQLYLVFDQMVRAAGSSPMSQDGKKPNLDSPEVVKVLTLWRDLIKKHKCIDPNLGPAAGMVAEEVFTDKKAAIFQTAGAWYVKTMKDGYPDLYKNYTVGNLPKFKATDKPTGGAIFSYGLLVPQASKHKDAAWRFATYLAAQGQRSFDTVGVWYGDKATFTSAATQKSENWSVFRDSINNGVFLPTVVGYIQWITLVRGMVESVILGNVAPEQAVKDAQIAAIKLLYS